MLPLALHVHVQADLPQKLRARTAPAFELTDRDIEVLKALHYFRVLERAHIEQLFFPNPSRACARLRLLYQHGYIERIDRPRYPKLPNPAPAYRLALLGAKMLADRAGVPLATVRYWGKGDDRDGHQTRVTAYFLEHALAVARFRIALEHAARRAGCAVEVWRDDVDMRQAQQGSIVVFSPAPGSPTISLKVAPDGYFMLRAASGQRGYFFVEVDRGSETVSKAWKRKTLGYKGLFATGAFHEHYQVDTRDVGFRVLVTAPSLQRAQNIKAMVERHGPGELSQLFLFAPFADVIGQDVLSAPIWHRGGTLGPQTLL